MTGDEHTEEAYLNNLLMELDHTTGNACANLPASVRPEGAWMHQVSFSEHYKSKPTKQNNGTNQETPITEFHAWCGCSSPKTLLWVWRFTIFFQPPGLALAIRFPLASSFLQINFFYPPTRPSFRSSYDHCKSGQLLVIWASEVTILLLIRNVPVSFELSFRHCFYTRRAPA